MRQIARHVRQQHVIGDVGRNHHTDTDQQTTPVLCRNLFEGDFRAVLQPFAIALLQFIHVLLERRSLFQRMAQIETDYPQWQRQEEGNTPAPTEEVFFTNDGGDKHNDARTDNEARYRTKIKPTAQKTASTVRGVFRYEN